MITAARVALCPPGLGQAPGYPLSGSPVPVCRRAATIPRAAYGDVERPLLPRAAPHAAAAHVGHLAMHCAPDDPAGREGRNFDRKLGASTPGRRSSSPS